MLQAHCVHVTRVELSKAGARPGALTKGQRIRRVQESHASFQASQPGQPQPISSRKRAGPTTPLPPFKTVRFKIPAYPPRER
ncbi:hypothetical protein BVI1335_400100 [Burkholderia vietnamiensis]|nr:hypothetical protein BVI1335_400100 [Burkholderia vietnamiensis]